MLRRKKYGGDNIQWRFHGSWVTNRCAPRVASTMQTFSSPGLPRSPRCEDASRAAEKQRWDDGVLLEREQWCRNQREEVFHGYYLVINPFAPECRFYHATVLFCSLQAYPDRHELSAFPIVPIEAQLSGCLCSCHGHLHRAFSGLL